jgi:hypothetical protein
MCDLLMLNHIPLLLQAPTTRALGEPLGWFMVQTVKALHKTKLFPGRRSSCPPPGGAWAAAESSEGDARES